MISSLVVIAGSELVLRFFRFLSLLLLLLLLFAVLVVVVVVVDSHNDASRLHMGFISRLAVDFRLTCVGSRLLKIKIIIFKLE